MNIDGFEIIITSQAECSLAKIKGFVCCIYGEEVLFLLLEKLEELLKHILSNPFMYPIIDKQVRKAILSKHYSLIFIITQSEIVIINFWVSKSANNFY